MVVLYYVTYGFALHYVTFILVFLYCNLFIYFYLFIYLFFGVNYSFNACLILIFYVLHVISHTEINQ